MKVVNLGFIICVVTTYWLDSLIDFNKIFDAMETITYTSPVISVSALIPKLFNNRFLADISFTIENKVIYAHSFVLMCRSGYFHKNLSANTRDKKPVITITDYSYVIFYQFLKFVYTDNCSLHGFDIALNLLQLAIAYEVVTLENLIIANFTTRPLTTVDRLRLFQFHESQPKHEYVRYTWIQDCVAPYAVELFESNVFLKVSPSAIENILKWCCIGRKEKPLREFDIFNHFAKWLIAYTKENQIADSERRKIFDRLKFFVRFPLMLEFEFRECMKTSDRMLELTEFYYSSRFDYTLFHTLHNTISRKRYTKSEDCKWMARCYLDQDEIPTYISPIGTKLIAFQIISYYPIWSVTLRQEPPDDLSFPMCFYFKDQQCRKYISLGDSVRIDRNYKYYIHINIIKEGRIINGRSEDITNTSERPFYTKRSIIHGYEIETFFKK